MKQAAIIKARFSTPRDMARLLGLSETRAREIERDVETSLAHKTHATFSRTDEGEKNGAKSFRFEATRKPATKKQVKVSKRAKAAKASR